MNNILLFIATLFVLALSALFAAPYFIDWNDHRHVFEQQASRLIGRTVNVGGNVSLTFLPSPVLRFENVNVADRQGSFDTPFLSARTFTVWLAVPPLLRGVIEAHEVELDQPVLNLQIGADGEGNWRDVGRPDVTLPFMPRSVALDSMKIAGATVTLARGAAEPYLVLDHLDGELSARSLQGPYKFTGTFKAGGETRELRFSTGLQEGGDPVRLKALVTGEKDLGSYQIDGDLVGFGAVPRFNGAFYARFADTGHKDDKAPGPDALSNTAPVEIKAQVAAGFERARFTDVEATVRLSNKPQTITGRMTADYSDQGLSLDGALSSRWVDLDVLSGGGPADPAGAVVSMAERALRLVAALREARVKVSLEQAVLAGDLLRGVDAELEGAGDRVTLRRLTTQLPGESRLTVSGLLTGKEGGPTFTGELDLSGEKLNRLLGWAGFGAQDAIAAREGGFSLRGAVVAAPGTLALQEVTGQLFGSRYSGAFRFADAERRQFDLTLKSDRLDISGITGPRASPVSLPALLSMADRGDEGGTRGGPLAWLGDAEARIDVDIAALTLPGLGESALVAGLHVVDGDINVRKLRLQSDTGLDLQANGKLTGLNTEPAGSITLEAHAKSAESVNVLGAILGLDGLLTSNPARSGLLAPAELTAALRSDGDGKKGLAGRVQGTLGGSAVAFDLDLAGALADWRAGAIALSLSSRNTDGKKLLRQLAPSMQADELAAVRDSAGTFVLMAKGENADALKTEVTLKAGGLDWSAKGTAAINAEGFAFSGQSRAKLPDALMALRLAGVSAAPGRVSKPLEISGDASLSKGIYRVTNLAARTGGDKITGSAMLDQSAARTRIELDLETSSASLPFLFEPLVAWIDPESTSGIVRGVSRSQSFWPDEPMDAALLSSFDGALKLKTASLRLLGPLTLSEGQIAAKLGNGVLDVEKLTGGLYGGTFAASGKLSAHGNTLALDAHVAGKGIRLEKIAGGSGGALAKGATDLELSVQGAGLTPRGLAAGLNGKGMLKFAEGEVRRLSPRAPVKTLADFGHGDRGREVNEAKLLAAAARNLGASSFTYGAFEAPVEVRNGVIRVEKAGLGNPAGRLAVTTFLELATLNLDSEWVLSSSAGDSEEEPRITLAFAGPLASLGKMKPEIDTQALQRYVTIRRMEKDVERLEKLEVPGAKKRAPKKTPALPAPGAARPKTAPSAVQPASVPRPTGPKKAAIPVSPPAIELPSAPLPRPVPPVREGPAAPSGDAVTSTPLPPAAPATQGTPPLPWLGSGPSAPALPPGLQPTIPPAAQAPVVPPEAVESLPPASAPAPRPKWNPFQQDGS